MSRYIIYNAVGTKHFTVPACIAGGPEIYIVLIMGTIALVLLAFTYGKSDILTINYLI